MSTTSASISPAGLDRVERDRGRVGALRSERIVGTPTRSPHVSSWSAAAARKVSAAPSTTSLSSATSTRASLPTVVVLPVPLTPTTRMTAGRPSMRDEAIRAVHRPGRRGRAAPSSQASTSASLVGAGPSTLTLVRSRSTSSCRGGDAEVGGEQGVLDLLPRLLVEAAAGEQGEQALAEGRVAAGQAGAEASQPARAEAGRSRVGSSSTRMSSSTSGSAGRVGAGRVSTLPPSASLSRSVGGAVGDEGLRRWWRRRQLLLARRPPANQPDDARHEDDGDDGADGNDLPDLVEHGAHPCTVSGPPGRPFVL